MKELQTERDILTLIANMSCHGIPCEYCAMFNGDYCILAKLKKVLENADNTNPDA